MGDTIQIASRVDVVNGRAMVMRRPPDVLGKAISELSEWVPLTATILPVPVAKSMVDEQRRELAGAKV